MPKTCRYLPLFAALLALARAAYAYDATEAVEQAVAAYNHGDFRTAFRLLSQETEAGNSDAAVNLGYLYARGQGVHPDQAKALDLYRQAAEKGNPEGMNAVGYKFQFGTGVKANIDEAIRWYCAAAQRGNPRALNNLAILYDNGIGVERSTDEARSLWRQAAERGSENAMANLGLSLAGDRSASGDMAEGVRWLRMAAAQGQGPAQQALRRLGYDEAYPPTRELAGLMRIQPKDLPPGHSRACGDFVS